PSQDRRDHAPPRAHAGSTSGSGLAARGETPAAFGRRCIPAPPHGAQSAPWGPRADCVAPPSNIPDIAPHRAQDARWGPRSAVVTPLRRGPHGADCAPWGGEGRLAALAATLEFHHGLLDDPAVRSGLSVLVLLALSAAILSAQGATGELRVMVNDATGLGVATTLELTSESNQLHERVATDPGGRAVVTRLPDGIYRLRAQPPGFGSDVESVEIRSAVPRDVRIGLYP